MDKFIGKRLDGRYEISELIGVGGMAIVYKAYDNIDDRIVAIKILKEEFLANDEFRRRFKNESKAIAVLSHPNIVKVYDVSFGDVLQYIVMEYINGITLKNYIEQQGIIEWKEAIHFTSQILKALEHAHEKGIIHRDIKPQNIMLLPNGNIKVTDFGIARFSRSEQRTITNKAIGSVHYISPEQARGDFTDGRSDIYSVGVMLYEMTTGRVPFQADSAVSVAIMQLQNEPVHPTEINSMIPKGLEEITLKAMKKDAVNRFDTAQEMLDDLNEVATNPSVIFDYQFVAVIPSGNTNKSKKKRTKTDDDDEGKSNVLPILSGIAIVLVIALIIAGVFVVRAFTSVGDTKTFDCPDLIGQKYDDINKEGKYNLIKSPDSAYNADYAEGVIYKQSPEKGTKIKSASEILVYVSLGATKLNLKDYSNMDLNTVKEEFTDNGLKMAIKKIASNDIQEGYVISTNPLAGSAVRTGDTITVYVSSGEEVFKKSVPDIIGLSTDSAKKTIEDNGFKVGSVSYEYSSSIAEGYVIYQSPSGGKDEDLGSSISFTVSRGARPTDPPTTRPKTTVPPENTVGFSISLPDYAPDASVTASSSNSSVSVNGTAISVTGKGTTTVTIYLDGRTYEVYNVNLDTGDTTTSGPNDLSSHYPTEAPQP